MKPPPTGNAGLHVRYEKAGLVLDALPVPASADAVIVEANVRLPRKTPRLKQDFTLRWSAEGPAIAAELLIEETAKAPMRVFFRVPTPTETSTAHVHWRDHFLGQIEAPIIGLSSIVEGFAIEMPTVSVTLGSHTVACQAFVSAQAKSVMASAILRCPCLLASVSELELRVQLKAENGEDTESIHIVLTPEQLARRQALVTVQLPRPRRIGVYEVSWWLASRCLHVQCFRTISRTTLLRSLRISAARFQLEMTDGTIQTVRVMPTHEGELALAGVVRVAPRFFVCSDEAGVAGLVPFVLRALVNGTIKTLATEDVVLVTDGPRFVVSASLAVDELANLRQFTLAAGGAVLGNLALLPAPSASFSAEGGFAPQDDYLWSPAAEEQLKDRLGKLLDEG